MGKFYLFLAMETIERENETLRAKLRGYATLGTCYHDAQQDAARLQRALRAKDATIAELRARLRGPEEGEETPVSQSLINSLCREIRKLKQKLHESHSECARKLETSQTEIERLQGTLVEKERHLEMPEREKDGEIQRLRSCLAQQEKAQATRDVLCSSLAEEAQRLRVQLSATVRVCQELLGRLETEQKSPVIRKSESSAVSHLGVCLSSLREENNELKKRVKYVESLNCKWQMYDSSREEYVRGLGRKLKESGGSPSVQLEISRLNGLLKDKMEECERLGRERRNDQEHIQMLEQQILAYVEDFKSERVDRERAQGRILDLQEEVGRLKLEIRPQEPSPSRRIHAGLKKPPDRLMDTVEPLRTSACDLQTRRNLGGAGPQGSQDLQCPLCLTTYDDEHMAEYLVHLDECAKL